MSIKTLTNGKKYTFNSLGLESNRCIKYGMFTEVEEPDMPEFKAHKIDCNVVQNTDDNSFEINFSISQTTNTTCIVNYSLVYLNGSVLAKTTNTATIPSGVTGFTDTVSNNTAMNNYVGIIINSLSYNTSIASFSMNSIDDEYLSKVQVPATIAISGWDVIDGERIRIEVEFDNAINSSGFSGLISTLDDNLDEVLEVTMAVTNNYNNKSYSHRFGINPGGLYPGSYTEMEFEFENDFFLNTTSSDVDIRISNITPTSTDRFIISYSSSSTGNPNDPTYSISGSISAPSTLVANIYLYDRTEYSSYPGNVYALCSMNLYSASSSVYSNSFSIPAGHKLGVYCIVVVNGNTVSNFKAMNYAGSIIASSNLSSGKTADLLLGDPATIFNSYKKLNFSFN